MADAGDHALEQVARALGVELAEAQRVEHRDRARADREDVAQDAADAGGRALEGLDGADGWLWDSTLKATARPSPTSTAPAFSPGPMHHARALGRQRRAAASWSACRRSARTTSARTSPARPRWARGPSFSQISSYSASVRPSSRCLEAAQAGTRSAPWSHHRGEEAQPVGRAGERVDRVLGMRHQADDVAGLVAHAGDVARRAVGVVPGRVAEDHLAARPRGGRASRRRRSSARSCA